MLDIIENDLLKKHLPLVSYLRLDGSVPANNRHEIVSKFNSDPSIDILLLTTQVGGLGLNLTGADTVIFVEHDWNPMKDLQGNEIVHFKLNELCLTVLFVCFSYGPSSSNWTEEGGKCLSINYKKVIGRENYGLTKV